MLIVRTYSSRKSTPKRRGPAFFLDIDESGVAGQFRSQIFEIDRYCLRKRAVSIPGTQIGTREREVADASTSVEEPRLASTDAVSPVEVDFGSPKRPSVCGEINGKTDGLGKLPVVESNHAPHFCADMSYKELHMPCKQHGYHNRDARSPLIATVARGI